jgi:hypothetical protein
MHVNDEDECSPETTAAIRGHEQAIAADFGIADKQIYAIRYGAKPDYFQKFRPLFRAVCRHNPLGAAGYLDTLERDFGSVAAPPDCSRRTLERKLAETAREAGEAVASLVGQEHTREVLQQALLEVVEAEVTFRQLRMMLEAKLAAGS